MPYFRQLKRVISVTFLLNVKVTTETKENNSFYRKPLLHLRGQSNSHQTSSTHQRYFVLSFRLIRQTTLGAERRRWQVCRPPLLMLFQETWCLFCVTIRSGWWVCSSSAKVWKNRAQSKKMSQHDKCVSMWKKVMAKSSLNFFPMQIFCTKNPPHLACKPLFCVFFLRFIKEN